MTNQVSEYYLTKQELFLATHDKEQLTEIFGTDSVEYHEGMLARQKAWANLILSEPCRNPMCHWHVPKSLISIKSSLRSYPDRHTLHQAACNAVVIRHNRLERFKRQEASKGRKAAKRKVRLE